eukprot:TRINITY_DN10891_c0_g1_i1.p1 TRINITY_DN10891_c0_g1~~TRINITY_DN10891_c0_g1_i1.p1  ORF type:complete len:263 (+),score=55.79 TRINITY_DN10891_c0_g1_i1:110-898(+)
MRLLGLLGLLLVASVFGKSIVFEEDDSMNFADVEVGCTASLKGEVRENGTRIDTLLPPLGAIVAWTPSTFESEPPTGWAICNGLVLNMPSSEYHGQVIPDLRDVYPMGGDVTTAGQRAVKTEHTHEYTIKEHEHDYSHSHPDQEMETNEVDDHFHTTIVNSLCDWYSYVTATKFSNEYSRLINWINGVNAGGSGYFPLSFRIRDKSMKYIDTDNNGGHTHAMRLNVTDFNGTTTAEPQKVLESDPTEHLPPTYHAIYIMRVL